MFPMRYVGAPEARADPLTVIQNVATLLPATVCNKVAMQHHEAVGRLRAQGYRLTRQRTLILDVISRNCQHLSADEIHREVVRHNPAINLATVYRTLNWLHGAGLIRKIDVGRDRLLYEYAAAGEHHHLICRACEAEYEIDHHVFEKLREHILEHYDFEADPEHVAIFGRCSRCRT
jgi:Fur family transcriptional regulator, ferric uptake regulator